MSNYNVTESVSSFKMPVLILSGKSDVLITEEMAKAMHNRISISKLVLLEGTHNWFLLEPDKVNPILEDNYSMFEEV